MNRMTFSRSFYHAFGRMIIAKQKKSFKSIFHMFPTVRRIFMWNILEFVIRPCVFLTHTKQNDNEKEALWLTQNWHGRCRV